MTDWIILLLNIISDILRAVICFFLIYRLLRSERPVMKMLLIEAAGIAGVTLLTSLLSESIRSTAANGFFNESNFYRLVLEICWIGICASRLLKTNIRMCLFISTFYGIAIAFWQFLFSAGLGILSGSDVFLNSALPFGQAAPWILNLLLILLFLYVAKKPQMTGQEAFRLASLAALVGFLAVITLSEQSILDIPDDTLDMWVILSIILMMSILVLNISRQYETEKELARLKSEQAELLERDYTTLNRAYAVNAKLFHDFHNHIGTLRQFLTHEKYEDAIRYLDDLQEPIRNMTDTVWTGDETIDYLINSKIALASQKQIQLEAQVEFPRHTNIRSVDLSAILGNLLDNALEATAKVPAPNQRTVFLTIRRIHQMLVIKVENTYAEKARMEKGTLQTTKSENGLHGWGLKSAQTAAQKYDGMVQTTYDGNLFRAVVTLSYQKGAKR